MVKGSGPNVGRVEEYDILSKRIVDMQIGANVSESEIWGESIYPID